MGNSGLAMVTFMDHIKMFLGSIKSRYMKKVLAVILMATFASTVFAHSGGTDSSGCHTNHKTGDRHCH